jgi:hypothetical protein
MPLTADAEYAKRAALAADECCADAQPPRADPARQSSPPSTRQPAARGPFGAACQGVGGCIRGRSRCSRSDVSRRRGLGQAPWGVLPKSFGPRLDLGTRPSRLADPISRRAATDANGSKTKKSSAYPAALRGIELPRLHTLAELQTNPGPRPFGQRTPELQISSTALSLRTSTAGRPSVGGRKMSEQRTPHRASVYL